MRKIEAQGAASSREFGARFDQPEHGMQDNLAEATGTLPAYLGEIEDKLDRALVSVHAQDTAPPSVPLIAFSWLVRLVPCDCLD